jgi:hypothetical protein
MYGEDSAVDFRSKPWRRRSGRACSIACSTRTMAAGSPLRLYASGTTPILAVAAGLTPLGAAVARVVAQPSMTGNGQGRASPAARPGRAGRRRGRDSADTPAPGRAPAMLERPAMIPVQYRALAVGPALLLAMALAGAAGWFTNGWRHDAEIAKLQRAYTETMHSQSELALTTLQADAARITKAATEFATIQSTLAPRMSALTKELRNTALCLLVACLILTACATSTPQSMLPTKAPLDSALSAPCQLVERPGADDYHAWQAWVIELLRLYATCPGRHAKTVQAWPK